MFAITRKLKALKPIFRGQRQKRGNLSNNVKLAATFLDSAQALLARDRQCSILLHLEFCCKLILRLATRLEQNMLHQRAKIAWMKGGDQCSRIFFRKVAKRRASNRVFQITDAGGRVLTEREDVITEFTEYYQNLLGGERRHCVLDLCYLRPWARHVLSDAEALTLVKPVTPNEIKLAMFDIDEVKAPGPDGYSSGFFKAVWPVVGEEVTRAIMEFFRTGRLLKQVNSTLISLISKVANPTSVTEFRPISCCNILYKIITKVIIQRMRTVLDLLISPSQNAFVPGWSIGDNIVLAQELFHGGLRQGDPMSPYLFVLVMEGYTSSYSGISRKAPSSPLFGITSTGFQVNYCRLQAYPLEIDDRIRGWNGNTLSFAGRVQLIKSVLTALQVYWAMAFILPKMIIREIEKRLRSFLWKGSTGMGYAKVSWQQVCRPVAEGGLGLRDILALNRGLMSRHLWRVIVADRSSIWVDWIIHYRLRGTSIWTVSACTGSWGWRKLVRLRAHLRPCITYRVGLGSSFSLWHDPWHALGPLITSFPLGPRHTDTSPTAPLSLVIRDGWWNWLRITDMESIDITYASLLYMAARTGSSGQAQETLSHLQLPMTCSVHQDPK
ncbi:UNVERIFIED_CONTAM: hypothetical protein Sradi_2080400 [Sesamum radiatum]|uniref:Reverse transcriptase domain-containing protein n=1 Tax=Sesamum radiatum TaxID=300843 RepID=A0AAW2TL58_SESRA